MCSRPRVIQVSLGSHSIDVALGFLAHDESFSPLGAEASVMVHVVPEHNSDPQDAAPDACHWAAALSGDLDVSRA